jgi:chemotaxis protein MotB
MQSMPELAELSKQLIIDQTPEGLSIQLVDQEGRSMFEQNSARPNPRAQLLLRDHLPGHHPAAEPHLV